MEYRPKRKPRRFSGDFCQKDCPYLINDIWPCCSLYKGEPSELSFFDKKTCKQLVSLRIMMLEFDKEQRWARCENCIQAGDGA